MKRRLESLGLLVAMMIFFAFGCGKNENDDAENPTGPSKKEIISNISNHDINSFYMMMEIDAKLDLQVSGLDINVETKISEEQKKAKAGAEGKPAEWRKNTNYFSMTDSTGAINKTTRDIDEYYQIENDEDYDLYFRENNKTRWQYQSLLKEDNKELRSFDFYEAIDSAVKNGILDAITLSPHEEKVDDNNCYIFTYEGKAKDFISYFASEEYIDVLTDASAYGIDSDRLLEALNISAKLYVDSNDFYVRRVVIDLTDINVDMALASAGADVAKLGIDNLSVNQLVITFDFDNLNKEKVEKPKSLDTEKIKK